jgi:hypothetical protein
MRNFKWILVWALLAPIDAEGQAPGIIAADREQPWTIAASAWIDGWSIESGHMGTWQQRIALGASIGAQVQGGELRLAWRYAPEGDVEPGWMVATVEVEPRVDFGRLYVGGRLSAGGLKMNVANRHSVIAECRPEDFCMFEAKAFTAGWSSVGGVALLAGITVVDRLELNASYGVHKLFHGSNHGELLPGWSVAARYRIGLCVEARGVRYIKSNLSPSD